jgi:hypothetical protein
MRYVSAAFGFATGGLASVAVAMALQVYVEGYTYRGTPMLGNLIFSVAVLAPYVLCGSLGFAFGLRLFGVAPRTVRSLLIGAGFAVAVGLLNWALHRLFRFNPFDYSMVGGGILMLAAAIPAALMGNQPKGRP